MTDSHLPTPPSAPDAPDTAPNRHVGWVAGGVAAVLVLVGATFFWLTRPQPTLTPAPAPAPITVGPSVTSPSTKPAPSRTPSATAKPKPSASGSATPKGGLTTAPASLGELPPTVNLPHEGAPAADETSAWEAAPWGYGCPGRLPEFRSFEKLVASRNIQATGLEWAASETVLVFRSDAAAQQFVDEVKAVNASCDGPGEEDEVRTRTASGDFPGDWDSGVSLRMWDEHSPDNGATWNARPGAGLDLVVRRGRAVVISSQGGEYVGDPITIPEVVKETRATIDVVAPQLCSFTARGC